ncbi:DNA methylase [Geobacillus sp. C56-T2]|uniref:DNA methylase n=1 Tax=Geobacillus sp. C56-T2 TaxID=600773 RepID=UPI0011A3A289|nr:DNA methylase [Geobacillus sp. C56-T2]TWG29511.1 hypothetical protein GC56T2_0590 [Geobacillus sp. C56-T2]
MAILITKQLQNIDNALVEELNSLPVNTWDFKEEDTRALTHGIHNYPAVMVYPISRALISIFKKHQPNIRTFFDPYMGSGTCLVEGILADMEEVYGTDLNPLARLISKVKTVPLEPHKLTEEIFKLYDRVDYNFNELNGIIERFDNYVRVDLGLDVADKDGWGKKAVEITTEYLHMHNLDLSLPNISNLGYWFLPKVVLELQLLKNCIKLTKDKDIRDFFWVAFSETVRLTSNRRNGEFKMFRMPPDKVREFRPNVLETFMNLLQRNEQKMVDFYEEYKKKKVETKVFIYKNNTMELPDIPDNSIDLLITSPPYGDSRTTVAYGQFSRTALEWLDMEDEPLTEKDIRNIDKELLGGKVDKEIIFDLPSKTLERSFNVIKAKDEKRALDVYAFYRDLNISLGTITRKMKANSYQCWVVGNRTVKEEQLLTSQILIELGEQYGLEHVITLGRNIPNKVMPLLNSPTNKAGAKVTTMTNEHIVILRKKA